MLWRQDEHQELTSRSWDVRLARDALDAIAAISTPTSCARV
jgi:hypothetical protein